MKKTASFFYVMTIATAIGAPGIYAEDGICHRCEVIREQNKTEHRNYEYYEDYLKSEGKGEGQTSHAPAVKNTRSNSTTPSNGFKRNFNSNNNSDRENNNNNNNNNSNNNNSNSDNGDQNNNFRK